MKSFKYMGKYINEESLPYREHPEAYVQFKEPDDMKALAKRVNIISLVITVFTVVVFVLRIVFSVEVGFREASYGFMIGCWLSLLTLLPHELLHGVAMNGDVKLYQNLKQGMLFVISTDDMSKKRFILMSLFPNIVFGFVPFIIFLLVPKLVFLGALGAFSIGAGAGDYLNVFNAATQVPKDAKIYLSGIHSYWYR